MPFYVKLAAGIYKAIQFVFNLIKKTLKLITGLCSLVLLITILGFEIRKEKKEVHIRK